MTQDDIDRAQLKTHQTSGVMRRKTMATSELKELLSHSSADPFDKIQQGNESDSCLPEAATTTRRLSIGGELRCRLDEETNDWELPRLDIEGFVVDYFSYRISKTGFEWYQASPLPYGTQPEHEMMRSMAAIFEKKHKKNLEMFTEQLLASPKMTFSIYQEVVRTVGYSSNDTCPMNYGRLIGLIAFGGMVAAKMIKHIELSEQVRNLTIYTSLFIKSRIRASWKEHKRSWAGFMELGETMKARYEAEEEEVRRDNASRRRWSIFGVSAAAAMIGVVVGGRLIFGSLK